MTLVTLRVLDGADRGKSFRDLPTPVSVGREEGNTVQLNDERVSRFHLKLQEERGKIVLTDLESTNGTKVNGENVQLSLLRPGDLIAIGRTTLLFGSRDEIARRLAELRQRDLGEGIPPSWDDWGSGSSAALDEELALGEPGGAKDVLHTLLPPELPDDLSPGQAAQLAELLQFLHLRFRGLVESVRAQVDSDAVVVDARQWQNIVDLHDRIARYLRRIGEPGV